jgi:hypothetical protein
MFMIRPSYRTKNHKPCADLKMCTAWGPLHLLLFGEPLADHGVDRGLYECRGNSLAESIPLAVIDEARCIRGDIDAELASGGDKFGQIRIA